MPNTNTLLLIGAGVVGVYLLTRPHAPQVVGYNSFGQPVYSNVPGLPAAPVYNPGVYGQPSDPLAQQIAAGGSALKGLGDLLGNFFGGD